MANEPGSDMVAASSVVDRAFQPALEPGEIFRGEMLAGAVREVEGEGDHITSA